MPEQPFFVFLSHGLESGPGSTKIQALKAVAEEFDGVRAEAIDHRSSKDPAVRLKQMRAAIESAGAGTGIAEISAIEPGDWRPLYPHHSWLG